MVKYDPSPEERKRLDDKANWAFRYEFTGPSGTMAYSPAAGFSLTVLQKTEIREQLHEYGNDCYVIGWANGKGEPAGQSTEECEELRWSKIMAVISNKETE